MGPRYHRVGNDGATRGLSSFPLNGKMIDPPVVSLAHEIPALPAISDLSYSRPETLVTSDSSNFAACQPSRFEIDKKGTGDRSRLDLFIVDIRRLRYFVGIVEAGSFTKAAATLNVAQSALSLHVRQLEEGFGTQLLVRDRTGVSVTASGDKLLEPARIILKEIQLTEAELTNTVAAPSGEVTIGIPSGAARVLSGPLLESVRSELPRISLKMIEA
ncbi:hypothetical protein MES5069_450066 [Mesorhizobium escarrei]|uniref:HTH lysR-type domain-containing protein n=1 Tax=Mesorhizobium escarrei TaxID=666018 RepID=A0ABM9E7N9_9HYPH|nr:hypothetical protein MES5069_450066 [Mesorhizobium escarrei]